MEKMSTKYKAVIIITAVLLIALCALLWGLSSQAATDKSSVFPVYISEIVSTNNRYSNSDGICCDYIEIYNSADYPVKISGYQITDGGKSKRYSFPSDTTLGAGEYILVGCTTEAQGDYYAGFGISREGGETIQLLTKKGALIEELTTVETAVNEAMYFDIDGNMTLGKPSPGCAQGEYKDTANYTVSSLRINEYMASNSSWPDASGICRDWLELHNTSENALDISGYIISDKLDTENPDCFYIPDGTVIPADGYLVIYCGEESGQLPFGFSKYGGESIYLMTEDGLIADIIDTSPLEEDESMALMSDGTWQATTQCSPGYENSPEGYEAYQSRDCEKGSMIIITEAQSANKLTLCDSYGEFPDWIELYNSGNETVSLKGWYLSDDPEKPTRWEIPGGTIKPGEYLVIFCDGRGEMTENGELHAPFSLASSGETVVLTNAARTAGCAVEIPGCQSGSSWALNDDTDEYEITDKPTPGFANTDGGYECFEASQLSQGPLAIWEFMSSNDGYLRQSMGKCYDWVEIKNISGEEVNLSGYTLTNTAGNKALYELPDVTLQPGEYICIILSGDERMTTAKFYHAGFTLSASGDKILLYNSEGMPIDWCSFGAQYAGMSFGRLEGEGGWFVMPPTPGADNADGVRYEEYTQSQGGDAA